MAWFMSFLLQFLDYSFAPLIDHPLTIFGCRSIPMNVAMPALRRYVAFVK